MYRPSIETHNLYHTVKDMYGRIIYKGKDKAKAERLYKNQVNSYDGVLDSREQAQYHRYSLYRLH